MPRYYAEAEKITNKLEQMFIDEISMQKDIKIISLMQTLGHKALNIVKRNATADVQEVIYCKNCKNYWKFENGAVVCEEFGGYIKDTDFCSRGAKMDRKD